MGWRRWHYHLASKSCGKKNDESSATLFSSFPNLRMLLAQHKNYLRLRRNKSMWRSALSLLRNRKAMWVSCVCVAPHKQSNTSSCASGKQVMEVMLEDKNVLWVLKGLEGVRWDIQIGRSKRETNTQAIRDHHAAHGVLWTSSNRCVMCLYIHVGGLKGQSLQGVRSTPDSWLAVNRGRRLQHHHVQPIQHEV